MLFDCGAKELNVCTPAFHFAKNCQHSALVAKYILNIYTSRKTI